MSARVTLCTSCAQEVGVSPDWNRQQAGQVADWKIARHRRERSGNKSVRQRTIPMCPGGGVVVHPNVVMTREVSA